MSGKNICTVLFFSFDGQVKIVGSSSELGASCTLQSNDICDHYSGFSLSAGRQLKNRLL